MKIYTKTGDDGTTGLFGGSRVSKASPRVEAYGTIDELNASLGLVLTASLSPESKSILLQIQEDLFTLGSELACAPGKESKLFLPLLGESSIAFLEQSIDACEEKLTPLSSFILPGGSPSSAFLHVARTVCRRAERAVLLVRESLEEENETTLRTEGLIYLNRLSDLLFVLARYENAYHHVADTPWIGQTKASPNRK